MISDSVKFLLNDELVVIKNPDPNQTLLNYIRTELKKTGTKEGCSEGGCGACTIVLGELVGNKIIYKAINSCISFVPSLNGKQLLIVEDLVSKDGTNEIQEFIELYFISFLTNSPKTIVHAPQPPSEHPSLVPVFFSSVLI